MAKEMNKEIIVIGGGPAGMMAAICAANQGAKVTLLEKNEKLGKKLFITGKGRCNLTNAGDTSEFFDQVVSNPKFLYSSIYGFDAHRVMDFFMDHGLSLKTERGNRVFPASDHSSDVIKALERTLRQSGVTVHTDARVKSLISEHALYPGDADASGGLVSGVILASGEHLKADAVILATGGKSYPSTGSTGDGYGFATSLGHTVNPPYPALVPFVCEEACCKDMMGLTLKNVAIYLRNDKKTIYEGFGEMLFTHFGVSGPLILSAASYAGKENIYPLRLEIDLKPALDREKLDLRLQRDFTRYAQKRITNAMDDLLPKKLIPHVIAASGIDDGQKAGAVSKKDREKLCEALKAFPLTVLRTGEFKEAIITGGGIHVKEVDPSTMASKKVRNLYFAGEILDVDALTGGYNLQIAWSTGYAAGMAAATE